MNEEAINAPTTKASPPRDPARKPYDKEKDDMYDAPASMEGPKLLARMLKYLQEKASGPYWKANEDAMEFQEKHRRVTMWALATGTAAVTAALLQLITFMTDYEYLKYALAGLECLAASLAGFYVYRGVKQAVQKKWLLERHKAERLRFLKYRMILEAATVPNVSNDLSGWQERVDHGVEEILDMNEVEMKRWLKENEHVAKDDASLTPMVGEKDLEDILEYYKRKRLDVQLRYLFNRTEQAASSDSKTKNWPAWLFVASIVCAILHMVFDLTMHPVFYLVGKKLPALENIALGLIIGAAVFPVWGAAIRTHRAANEFSRNTVRFNAVYQELKGNALGLTLDTKDAMKLRLLWQSEEALENEHREWLRLMDEAEWYG
jgi:hypothetical protein